MIYSFTTKIDFESTHEAPEPERCMAPHGHRFTVVATVEHEELYDGMPRGSAGFEDKLRGICAELDHRPLTEMMPGVTQTLPGLAAHLFERMAAAFPQLKSVGVFDGTSTGTVERQ